MCLTLWYQLQTKRSKSSSDSLIVLSFLSYLSNSLHSWAHFCFIHYSLFTIHFEISSSYFHSVSPLFAFAPSSSIVNRRSNSKPEALASISISIINTILSLLKPTFPSITNQQYFFTTTILLLHNSSQSKHTAPSSTWIKHYKFYSFNSFDLSLEL